MKSKMGLLMATTLALSGMLPEMKQTESEQMISEASLEALINEYKLIQQKKSGLTKSQRDMVCGRIHWLLRDNKITEEMLKLP